jgi:carboxyl-terminal processing protease
MNTAAKKIAFVLSLGVLGYVSLGYVFGRTSSNKTYQSLTIFSEVLDHIQQEYVDQPNMHLVTVGALHGLVESLDPDSSYLGPREYEQYKKQAADPAKGSIGIAVSRRFGYVMVVSALPDSPALKAGLQDGDILESIAGFSSRDMSVNQAELLLEGAPGTTVKVSVVRPGHTKPQEFEIPRVVGTVPPLLETRLEGGIAYLRVPEFNAGRANEIRQALLQFERQGAQKLILDLRDSALGEPQEAIATAQLFLSSGTIAMLRGQTITTTQYSADPAKQVWKLPMTVLINPGTAGPAEILAAAISGNHRGETVGQNTFGTAGEQRLIPLEDGGALVLTVGDYFTPDDKIILKGGVAPTVSVETSLDVFGGANEEIAPGPPPGQLPSPKDPVMKKAIELLQSGATASPAA